MDSQQLPDQPPLCKGRCRPAISREPDDGGVVTPSVTAAGRRDSSLREGANVELPLHRGAHKERIGNMAKLYFKYGAMGSSKSAQALITKFNYEEQGMSVWLIKPSVDTRDGADIIRSRIGLESHAQIITPEQDIAAAYRAAGKHNVIIADEAQFFTPQQIDQLRSLVDEEDLPVLCFGLRTDFLTHFFPGACRLMELADSITEIKTICKCGRKATVNARIDANGRIVTQGDQVMLGGNDSYVAMCHSCWKKQIREQQHGDR